METLNSIKRQILDIDNVTSGDMLMRRTEGFDWPVEGLTMIGLKRMDNIQFCLEEILKKGIEGDVLEAGVWKGGACIFMKAILNQYKSNKKVFVCDSFKGLPPPEVDQDKNSEFHTFPELSISLHQVKTNFNKYNLLDDRVIFVEGWFKDTLPVLKEQGHKYSLIRLDGDMYKSTMDQLENLYEGVSIGGFIIIDDWAIPQARLACEKYREINNITDEIVPIDQYSVYWVKTK